jgi:hypothetical protein
VVLQRLGKHNKRSLCMGMGMEIGMWRVMEEEEEDDEDEEEG